VGGEANHQDQVTEGLKKRSLILANRSKQEEREERGKARQGCEKTERIHGHDAVLGRENQRAGALGGKGKNRTEKSPMQLWGAMWARSYHDEEI